jgi:hypothetical protein
VWRSSVRTITRDRHNRMPPEVNPGEALILHSDQIICNTRIV